MLQLLVNTIAVPDHNNDVRLFELTRLAVRFDILEVTLHKRLVLLCTLQRNYVRPRGTLERVLQMNQCVLHPVKLQLSAIAILITIHAIDDHAPVRASELRLPLIQPYHPAEQLGLNLLLRRWICKTLQQQYLHVLNVCHPPAWRTTVYKLHQ